MLVQTMDETLAEKRALLFESVSLLLRLWVCKNLHSTGSCQRSPWKIVTRGKVICSTWLGKLSSALTLGYNCGRGFQSKQCLFFFFYTKICSWYWQQKWPFCENLKRSWKLQLRWKTFKASDIKRKSLCLSFWTEIVIMRRKFESTIWQRFRYCCIT